jgi:hypothetical protein
MTGRSAARTLAIGLVAALAAALGWAAPALAHIDVKADKARAGATDVTLTFVAESESSSAGIASLRVVLPPGIAPADVSYVSGPRGWTFTPGADGYTVAGPALRAGQDATHRVKVAQLPTDTTVLPFKVLQTYSNGRVDRWIEVPSPGGPEPDNPAAVLTVAEAAPTTAPPATTPPAPTTAPATSAPPTSAPSAAGDDSQSSAGAWWIAGAVLLVAVLIAAVWLVRRRTPRPGADETA